MQFDIPFLVIAYEVIQHDSELTWMGILSLKLQTPLKRKSAVGTSSQKSMRATEKTPTHLRSDVSRFFPILPTVALPFDSPDIQPGSGFMGYPRSRQNHLLHRTVHWLPGSQIF